MQDHSQYARGFPNLPTQANIMLHNKSVMHVASNDGRLSSNGKVGLPGRTCGALGLNAKQQLFQKEGGEQLECNVHEADDSGEQEDTSKG